MKKIIGLVGLNNNMVMFLKKKYRDINFLKIKDSNFDSDKCMKINALVILYEYPIKKKLPIFMKKKYKKFKNLNWVHLTRAGIDEFTSYLPHYKFRFSVGKKIQGPNVSEHCISLLLSLTRGLFDQLNQKSYTLRPTEIKNKKVLIVGLGGIGNEIALKLNSFGAKISSVNRSGNKRSYIYKNYSLNSFVSQVNKFDILINCLPLTNKTNKIFNKKIFNNMKKNSIFVSVSRDQTINLKDLMNYIKKRKFFGVAIDNTGSIKMKNKKVIYSRSKNLIVSDHLGWVTTDEDRRKNLIFNNIDAYIKGKKINYLVSKNNQY